MPGVSHIGALDSNLLQNLGFYNAVDDFPTNEQKLETQMSEQVARDRIQSFHSSLYKTFDHHHKDDMDLWKVADRDPLPTDHKDHLIVLGDAALPMLPTLGSGAGMAIGVEYELNMETQKMGRGYLSEEELTDFTPLCIIP